MIIISEKKIANFISLSLVHLKAVVLSKFRLLYPLSRNFGDANHATAASLHQRDNRDTSPRKQIFFNYWRNGCVVHCTGDTRRNLRLLYPAPCKILGEPSRFRGT